MAWYVFFTCPLMGQESQWHSKPLRCFQISLSAVSGHCLPWPRAAWWFLPPSHPHGQFNMQDGKEGTETWTTLSSSDSTATFSGQRWWECLSLVPSQPQLALSDSWISILRSCLCTLFQGCLTCATYSTGYPVSKQVLLGKPGPYLLLAPKNRKG